MGFWDKIKQLNEDSLHDRDSQPKQQEEEEERPKQPKTGLLSSWWERENKQNEYNKTHPTGGFTIGGSDWSITRNREYQDQVFRHPYRFVPSKGRTIYLTIDEIEENYWIVGWDGDIPMVYPK